MPSPLDCHECGAPFQLNGDGTTQHLDANGRIDHDADADHVPFTLEA